MKTLLLTFTLLMGLNLFAQDLIIKKDQTEVKAKVIELTDELIKYNKYEMLDGPIYSIKKSEVFMIVYKDGTKEYISNKATNLEANVINGNNVAIPSVTINTQIWAIKNLDVSTYNDGTPIPEVTDPAEWANLTTGAWCYYNNDSANNAIYGKLYNWYAVQGIHDTDSSTPNKKLAPIGWHIPNEREWTTLIDYLGDKLVAGGKMKEIGSLHWKEPNEFATNFSGFNGFPAGTRFDKGNFSLNGFNQFACWWSSLEFDSLDSYYLLLHYKFATAYLNKDSVKIRKSGFSVRCIKD
jgi:uncharacterized protein (TIGR02145 family)